MQWIVDGADADTGKDICITVDADNRIHAETVARERGVLVSGVRRALSPSDAIEAVYGPAKVKTVGKSSKPAATVPHTRRRPMRRDVSASSIAEGLAVQIEAAPRQAPVEEASHHPAPAGGHALLRLAGVILVALSVPTYIVGIAAVTLATIAFSHTAVNFDDPVDLVERLLALLMTGLPLVAAVLLHATGAGCFALRDIARRRRR